MNLADAKIFFALIATIIEVVAYFPYLKDIFSLKTKPHAYTWLIWIITSGTAAIGVLYGGGRWGALGVIVGMFLISIVFLFSLKYGTKNITIGDTMILIAALCAIFVWWQLEQPLLAVTMVSIIDIFGYIPTFRKSYQDPWSETLIFWIAFVLSGIFAIMALSEYNILTTTYLIAVTFANASLVLFIFFRRRFVVSP